MPKFTVKVAIRILEIYVVEAETEEEAREDWAEGSLLDRDDESLDAEVLSVRRRHK